MAEISNKALALLVLAALVVVVAATTIQLNRLNAIGVTGMPTTDTGTVLLTIQDALAIEVDTDNAEIDFGVCTPQVGNTIVANSTAGGGHPNCTGDFSSAQFIRVMNVGNVPADVEVRGNLAFDTFLPTAVSGDSDFEVLFEEETAADCVGTLQDTFTRMLTSNMNACSNLIVGGAIDMYAQVTIPPDTQPNTLDETNTITFQASSA